MEPVMLYCGECCKPLGRHAIVGECGHAFCHKDGARQGCAPTTGSRGAKLLSCSLCNCTRAAWRVGDDVERMPGILRDLIFANISFPITGISRASVKREIDIVVRRNEARQRYLAKLRNEGELDECCELMHEKARVRE